MGRLLGCRVIGSAMLCTQLFRDGGKESVGSGLMRLGRTHTPAGRPNSELPVAYISSTKALVPTTLVSAPAAVPRFQ